MGLGLGGALTVVGMRRRLHSAKPAGEEGVSGMHVAEEEAGLLANAPATAEGGYDAAAHRSDV
jgi:hypothetical protein